MKSAKKIGNDGEKKVVTVLSTLPRDNFRLFNNVLIKTKSGTTQIDHILVSTRGIFVIETKAHKGKIFGNTTSKYWTQCLFGKGKVVNKYSFYSPYYQNRGHLKNIISTLNTSCVCGIICFTSENVNLSSVVCESVTSIPCLYQVIYNIFVNSPIADYSFNEMCKRIESLNIQNSYQDRKHVKYVESLSKRYISFR